MFGIYVPARKGNGKGKWVRLSFIFGGINPLPLEETSKFGLNFRGLLRVELTGPGG